MNAVERVKKICKERKIPISRLEYDCGFANGYISQLRKGTFPDDRLRVISQYLNISAELLSTGEESRFNVEMADLDADVIFLSKEIKEYAIKLSKLSEDDRKDIMKMIDRLGK